MMSDKPMYAIFVPIGRKYHLPVIEDGEIKKTVCGRTGEHLCYISNLLIEKGRFKPCQKCMKEKEEQDYLDTLHYHAGDILGVN